jgi:outer membrane receptor protein involved in Fe transport
MKKLIAPILLLLCFTFAAFAQSGQVSGTVKDRNGAFIPGGEAVLTGPAGFVRRTAIGAGGEFSFGNNIAPGKYILRISASGFASSETEVEVAAGSPPLAIVLDIGSESFVVTAEVGSEVERQKIPQPTNKIGETRIRQRAISVLSQAGGEETGLNVQKTSPTMGQIVVRGLTGKNVVNYVDGVRYTTGAQRGGVNTFFNLNDASNLQAIEVVRGPSSAQYGSDSLSGTVNLLTRVPEFGFEKGRFGGEIMPFFSSANRSFGSNVMVGYGAEKFGGYVNVFGRRINTLRTPGGLDSHSAVTRFLGLPSNVLYDRNPDTEFTQYGGATRLNYSPREDQNLIFFYQRGQQDEGKRFDQLLGGDGNLIADLRNLMLDFGYLRYIKTDFYGFDTISLTGSFNSQREERINQGGQGNPFGDITNQYERTSVLGFSFYLDKRLGDRNTFLFGSDYYHEKVNSPAFTTNVVTGVVTLSRPRIPDEAGFNTAGLYVQDAWEAIPDRLRITGALRYSSAAYDVRAADAPIVSGRRLWNDDSLRTGGFSGRIGGVLRVAKGFRLAANYSRGFRYPAITDLGTLGLTGDGFEVDYLSSASLGGTIGTTAGPDAVTTGLPVQKQRSEISNNIDFSVRYQNKRFDTEFTVFRLDIEDAITKQALILPAGSVGQLLGSDVITSQNANGVVFVAASANPVLVRANFSAARIYGFEYEAEGRITDTLSARGNFTFTHAEDKVTGLPPNIEGGTPPPTAFLSLRYTRSRYWIEGYSTIADKQDRFSSLDLGDRRTGAARSRAQIENYFRRGGCVYGLTRNAAGTCNGALAGYTLVSTGENITAVLTRVLGPGFPTTPLFTSLPAYATVNLRGGFTINEKTSMYFAFENMFDKFYRNPSWGIDGAGRSFTTQLRYKF